MNIKRYPYDSKDLLQAWDAADELVLEHFDQIAGNTRPRILIMNDQFGALAVSLKNKNKDYDITVYTDSYLSFKGIQLNSQHLGENRITPISDLQQLSGMYDYVLIKIPKNMSFFEDMLAHVSGHLQPSSKIIAGYMIKHQSKTSFDLLNQLIGETTTSLAKKKARLIFCSFQKSKTESPYPVKLPIKDVVEHDFKKPFINHSNLFSREKLDIGTRFLLDHIPEGDFETILDLGCGNGIIGIAAKMMNPKAKIIFSDESEMAIQSAQANYKNYFPNKDADAEFLWTHCYGEKSEPIDLILCNPPFHQGNAVSDVTAWQMFKDSHKALKMGGTLRVIGNSQLLYQNSVKKIFGNVRSVAKNSKFTIVDATKEPNVAKTPKPDESNAEADSE